MAWACAPLISLIALQMLSKTMSEASNGIKIAKENFTAENLALPGPGFAPAHVRGTMPRKKARGRVKKVTRLNEPSFVCWDGPAVKFGGQRVDDQKPWKARKLGEEYSELEKQVLIFGG